MSKISYADVFGKLDDVRMGKVEEGIKFGQWNLDQYLRFKRGNFNVVLGHANVGKTSVTLYLMLLQAIRNDLRWLVFSSENTPVSLIKKISEFFLGKPINQIEEDEFMMAQDLIQRYFVIIDTDKKMYTYAELLEEATDIYHEEGFDGFMIDPYNSLAKDKEMYKTLGGHEYDYEVATHFRNWAKQHNVSIWLCAHAVTSALRMKHPQGHEYAGMPIPPSAADIESGGKWVNRADDFIVIHRYKSHPTEWMYNHIIISKVKEVETGGRPTPLDEPVKFRSLPNNVGFEIHGENLISKKEKEQGQMPF
ncbi:DnaB helicase C-terminal domain-containing protein [Planktomarina temperata]|nr:DnaB helicase C-terminal domain-containing protein [Planktomarina temperata]